MAEVGSWVWIPDDLDHVVPGEVLSTTADGIVAKLESGQELQVKISSNQLAVLDKQCLDADVSNLIGLSNLSENSILHNLRIRFHKERIYTFVSSILIAVNPFRQLPLYGVEIREKYLSTTDKSTLPPHIFTVADNSFRAMMADNLSQSVVISGESGAGKTESTKVLLEYIAELSTSGGQDEDDNLQHQILQCNPVMEAFGNAKTARNNNSSRFGKLITINFLSGEIKGASIISYLLEKSRVVHQQPQERNYHFFYQLIAGASGDASLTSMLMLGQGNDDKDACDAEDFWYTNQSNVHTIEGLSDLEEYNEVRTAMDSLGMSMADQNEVCKVAAAILHLGNVSFTEAETSGDVAAKIKEMSIVDTVCELLCVDKNEMERCLTSKNIGARSIITCRYTPLQAVDARDALSKKLYANLFDWLIKFINVSLAGTAKDCSQKMNFIAVLDIFGFEAFEHNSFEQLCINYCNEKLQFHFNNHIFLMEQAEYTKEGISVSNIKFEDNQPTLDLLDLRGTGIFSMIDEEINVPRGSDEQLLSKYFQKHVSNPRFERPKAKNHSKSVLDALFVVVHYAGPVAYNITGFLEKNKDQLSEDLEQMCKVSTSSFITTIFGVVPNAEAVRLPKVRSTRRIGSGLGKVTLGGEFKKQLVSLMDTLNSTEPHFVRCMKPNMEKVGKKFDSHVMLSQLRYAGLVEVCRIRQLGFPYRMVFQRFLSLYTLLAPNGGGSPQQLLGAIVEKGILTPDEFAIGTTKVFLKHLSLQKLNAGRDSALKGVVASIQKIIRGKLMRLRFANMKKILSNLQTAMQNSTGSVNVQQLEEALANSVELPHQGAHFPLVKEGRSLFRKVNEEIKIKALLEEAMSNRVMKALEAAIDTANSLQKPHKLQGLADVIKKAMASVNDMKRDKIHLDKVPALIKSGNLEDLQQWMEVAVQLNLGNTDGARSIEVIIARVCDERDVMDELVIAADAKDLPTLSAVLIRVAEMGLENAVVTKAKKTQQVLESINTGLTALTTALETRHLQSIKDGVNKAKECGVTSDNSLLKKATYVVDMMESVAFVESKLKVALNGQNIDELTKLIAQGEQALTLAKEHNFEVEIVSMSSAISLVDALNRQLKQNNAEKEAEEKVKAEHAEKLKTALERQEIPYLRSLLIQAKGMGLGAVSQYSTLLKSCDDAVEKMKIKQELEIALNLAMRSKNIAKIAECIANAEASGSDIKLESAIKLKSKLVAQQAIADQLSDALAKNDISILPGLLKAASDINLESRQVVDAKAVLDRGTTLSQVMDVLKNGKDSAAIVNAIEAAINFGMDKNDIAIESARTRLACLSANAARSQDFLMAVKNFEIRASSENGVKDADLNPLHQLLSDVTTLLAASSLDTALQGLLQDIQMQVSRGKNLIKHQLLLDGLSEDTPLNDVKAIIRKAADLGLKNYKGYISGSALLEHMNDLAMKNHTVVLEEEDFEGMTYEEMDRLKEEQHAEARQMHYAFGNFPNIRTPEEFAKGNMLNKRKIMESFLKHQKSSISRSLTALSGNENKLAVVAFKSLLGYIGDKTVTFPASHARDFVMIGLKNHALRAELLLQCVKQTISNPSAYSQQRAFQVLCMCCDHFPPPPDFHMYLLNFLLGHIDAISEGTDPSQGQHMSIYAVARIQIMVQQAAGNNDCALDDVDVETIESYSSRMPCVAKVYTPDNTLLGELLVAPDVDVETLLLLIAQILNVHPKRLPLLGLYTVTTKSSDLAPMILLPDRDFFVGDIYQPPLSQKFGRPLKYIIKRKLLEDSFVTPLASSDDYEDETEDNMSALVNLTFAQISSKMTDDSIRITNEKTAALLAAYQLAIEAEYIAGRADVALAQGVLKNLSPTLRETKEPNYWGGLIADALHSCVGKEDDELRLLYLELVDTLPTSRMHTYMCVKGSASSPFQTSEVPKEFILGVNSQGMFFMDCDDEKESPTSHYTLRYPLIKKFTLKSNTIKFTLEKSPGELYALEVVTPLNEELCQMCLAFRPRRK